MVIADPPSLIGSVKEICALDASGVETKLVGAGGGPVGVAVRVSEYAPVPYVLVPATHNSVVVGSSPTCLTFLISIIANLWS